MLRLLETNFNIFKIMNVYNVKYIKILIDSSVIQLSILMLLLSFMEVVTSHIHKSKEPPKLKPQQLSKY